MTAKYLLILFYYSAFIKCSIQLQKLCDEFDFADKKVVIA